MDIHYYLLCYRFEALVASHLEPEAFGRYMAVGTEKLSRGHVVFAEIDPGLQGNYFRLADIRERCVPRPDGSPKRSKYISIYRALEHLDPSMIGQLYLTTVDGRVLGLTAAPYDPRKELLEAHLYQELCPVSPLVVSGLPPARFCKFMTDPANPVSVPRLFFADLLLDRDKTGDLAGYLPYDEPMHIMRCVDEVETGKGKITKTVDRTPTDHAFFRTIRLGFFVGDQQNLKFYPFPALRDLEVQYHQWWSSASAN
ncbi:MAG: hypothetical protein ACM3VT_16785 [Solirubrobacterales bacterium]